MNEQIIAASKSFFLVIDKDTGNLESNARKYITCKFYNLLSFLHIINKQPDYTSKSLIEFKIIQLCEDELSNSTRSPISLETIRKIAKRFNVAIEKKEDSTHPELFAVLHEMKKPQNERTSATRPQYQYSQQFAKRMRIQNAQITKLFSKVFNPSQNIADPATNQEKHHKPADIPFVNPHVHKDDTQESIPEPVVETPVYQKINQDQLKELAAKYGFKTANLMKLRGIFSASSKIIIPEFEGIEHKEINAHIKKYYPNFENDWNRFREQYEASKDLAQCVPLLESIQGNIKRAFVDHPLQDGAIDKFIHGNKPITVRSTGYEDDDSEDENQSTVSNQGGNYSATNVTPDLISINSAIGDVVASYFSFKSLNQRKGLGDDVTKEPFMPVLLQERVGEVSGHAIPTSGVMYTQESELQTPNVVQINAVFGHAEAAVTGAKPTDRIYVHDEYVHQVALEKPSRLVPSGEGGLESKVNPKPYQRTPALTNKQARKLAAIGKLIEREYSGMPMDIEWSYDPEKDSFFVFQARRFRPSKKENPTYFDPEKLKQLDQDTFVPASIVVASRGACCEELTKENTIVVENVSTAIEMCNANPKIKTIIVRDFISNNSHEAGYLRSRGITVVNPDIERYRDFKASFQQGVFGLDIQEGLLIPIPAGRKISEFILPGLRRHLVPKMETSCQEEIKDPKVFLDQLVSEAKRANVQEVDTLIKETFGRNQLDKYLNAYELAGSKAQKAYILVKVLQITQNIVKQSPDSIQSQRLLNKVMLNARHVWNMEAKSDVERKFAMSWLRSSLIYKGSPALLLSDTLLSVLGEKKERGAVGITPKSDATAIEDIFSRTSKFAVHGDTKKAWSEFIGHLRPEQQQELAKIFVEINPEIIEIWINSSFIKQWNIDKNPEKSLSRIKQDFNNPAVRQAIEVSKKIRHFSQEFSEKMPLLQNPSDFDRMHLEIQKNLMPLAKDAFELMSDSSPDLTNILAAQAFSQIVEVFDNSIKTLTGSSSYTQDQQQQKAINFGKLLTDYSSLCETSMNLGIITDEMLKKQAKSLNEVLSGRLSRLMEKATKNENIDRIINPSPDFNVSSVALGSGMMAPGRIIAGGSFEDLFTTYHQSMMTVVQYIQTKKGIELTRLPAPIQNLCQSIQTLDLRSRDAGNVMHPTIQSIQVKYPDLIIKFNAPLNNHSAQFTLHVKMNAKGEPKKIVFEGLFVAPINAAGVFARAETLGMYALEVVDGKLLKDGGSPTVDNTKARFFWELSHDSSQPLQSYMKYNLQNMIDFLQVRRPLVVRGKSNYSYLEKYPELIAPFLVAYRDGHPNRTIGIEKFIQAINQNPSEENLKLFLENIICLREIDHSKNPERDPILVKILGKTDLDDRQFLNLISFLNYWCEYNNDEYNIYAEYKQNMGPIPPEIMVKIQSKVPQVLEKLNKMKEIDEGNGIVNLYNFRDLKQFLNNFAGDQYQREKEEWKKYKLKSWDNQ